MMWRLSLSHGTCRWECGRPFLATPGGPSAVSMNYSRALTCSSRINALDFYKSTDWMQMPYVQRSQDLIHATVLLHGADGPWSNRCGFDEVGAAVSGVFTVDGSLASPKQPPIVPICDNVVGWLGTVGILAALRRRAIEGGSYRVVVSLTRTCLWMLSLGIFDLDYARATAGSSDEHSLVAPELFTAETPMGDVPRNDRPDPAT